MRLAFLIFFLQLCIVGYGQLNISGRILSDQSGEPLSQASVYINNSTIGTTTGPDGSFLLSNIRPGNYDIVVSFVSFEILVHSVVLADKDLKFEFRLSPKAQQMRNILVMSDEKRKQMMELFRQLFLGVTTAGERCKIQNEAEILFEPGKGKNDIYAFAETPLIVINNELGYRISFDLQEFYLDQTTGRTFFYGYTRYEELGKGNPDKLKKRRVEYYLGSTMHFYHSMYADKAEQNGFSLFNRYRVSKDGKLTVVNEAKAASALMGTDSLRRKYMDWNGKIVVQYKRDPIYKAALNRKGFLQGSLPRGIESELTMLERPVYFTEQGLPENPMRIAFNGFWSFEKLGNMLPIDYRPEN
jgi:hypothetical protein